MSVFAHNPYTFNVLTKKAAVLYPPRDEVTFEGTLCGLSDGDDSDVEEEAPRGREDSKLEIGEQIPFFKYDPLFRSVHTDAVPLTSCVRLFAGQLPYQMPPSAVAWLLWVTTGVHVVRVEKILRGRYRQPCGCFHVYCLPRHESLVLAANELALIDGDGVWVAESASQVEELRSFCRKLQSSAELRVRGFPYRMVTLRPARSTYISRCAFRSADQSQQGAMEVHFPLYNVEVPPPLYSLEVSRPLYSLEVPPPLYSVEVPPPPCSVDVPLAPYSVCH